jgi:uncharacterized protein (DUF608 family)
MIAAGVALAPLPAGAVALDAKRVQLYKKISPEWVKSLYERGKPTVYAASRNELRYIGMPVGGVTAGGVYLGGDGRLWLWDIFNDNRFGIEPKLVQWKAPNGEERKLSANTGSLYVEPAQDVRPLQQGFALRFTWQGKTVVKRLEAGCWDDIEFEATYPVATVRYIDKQLPVSVSMKAFSPFIPLNEDDSSLPATVLSFSFENKGDAAVDVCVAGWLENKVALATAKDMLSDPTAPVVRRVNKTERRGSAVAVSEDVSALSSVEKLADRPDVGTMCLAAIDPNAEAVAAVPSDLGETLFSTKNDYADKPQQEALIGAVRSKRTIPAGETAEANFVVCWHFPNLKLGDLKDTGHYYQNKFKTATDVAAYVAENFDRLAGQTLLWEQTWTDSTLPHWFLERTLLTMDTLATTTCHRFSSGRFWAWEGVGCCGGTCTHVWQYAQAMGRVFPALERDCRERTDLGIALQPDGGITFRAEMESRPAIDGQAGTVLRCLREHQMSANDDFLRRNWNNIKRATQFIINQDKNKDGMEDTPLENTLDAVWDGEIAWIVGLCIAAVKAGQEMAEEMGDTAFAKTCADYVAKGRANMDKQLFNGEYYIHRPDKASGRSKLGSYNTCHIDQVMGQAWAYQVGLGHILDNRKVKSALRALWKYNYTSDVGPYLAAHQGGGRPYAVEGDAGLIINTNPSQEAHPYGENVTWQAGYFHECMTGFEYEVAAHMIAEGMTDEGLTLVRAIYDRYHAARRNPYNEIECSDHYARAMASYGAVITACGFEYHGPKGYMRFAPKWDADRFKAPFTAAEGWGTYTQKKTDSVLICTLQPRWGQLQLQTFSVDAPKGVHCKSASVQLAGQTFDAAFKQSGASVLMDFGKRLTVKTGQILTMTLTS